MKWYIHKILKVWQVWHLVTNIGAQQENTEPGYTGSDKNGQDKTYHSTIVMLHLAIRWVFIFKEMMVGFNMLFKSISVISG